jgi:hypothetical protein
MALRDSARWCQVLVPNAATLPLASVVIVPKDPPSAGCGTSSIQEASSASPLPKTAAITIAISRRQGRRTITPSLSGG